MGSNKILLPTLLGCLALLPLASRAAPASEALHDGADADPAPAAFPFNPPSGAAAQTCPLAFISRLVNKDESETTRFGVHNEAAAKQFNANYDSAVKAIGSAIPPAVKSAIPESLKTAVKVDMKYGYNPFLSDYFRTPTAKHCMQNMPKYFKDASDVEAMLAQNPMTALPGVPSDFVSKCLANPKVLRAAGVKRALTPREQIEVISDWYLAMHRIRTGWEALSVQVEKANSFLGRAPMAGVNCSDAKVPGSCAKAKEVEDCHPSSKGLNDLVARATDAVQHLDQKAQDLVKSGKVNCAQAGQCQTVMHDLMKDPRDTTEAPLDLETAKGIVVKGIPYVAEPGVKAVMAKMLDNQPTAPGELKEAYTHDLLRIIDGDTKKLNNVARIASCINGGDPSCFSDAWWQKWGKGFALNFTPDAQTMLADLPAFDVDEFMANAAQSGAPQKNAPAGKLAKQRQLGLAGFLSDAECLAVQREGYDQARQYEDEQIVNSAAVGVGMGLRALTGGIAMGKPLASLMNQARAANPGLMRVLGMRTNVNAADIIMKRAVSGPARASLVAIDSGVNMFWVAFGGSIVAESCQKFLSAASESAKSNLSHGCHRDFVSETLGLSDYIQCGLGVAMGGLPIVTTALGIKAPIKTASRYAKKALAPKPVLSTSTKIRSVAADVKSNSFVGPAANTVNGGSLPAATQIAQSNDIDFILGTTSRDPAVVQAAYRKRIKEFHPDKHIGDANQTDYEKAMTKINWAMEQIKKRQKTD